MSVFVWLENFDGHALSSSWEALGAAKIIAEAQATDITALVFGETRIPSLPQPDNTAPQKLSYATTMTCANTDWSATPHC